MQSQSRILLTPNLSVGSSPRPTIAVTGPPYAFRIENYDYVIINSGSIVTWPADDAHTALLHIQRRRDKMHRSSRRIQTCVVGINAITHPRCTPLRICGHGKHQMLVWAGSDSHRVTQKRGLDQHYCL